MADSNTMQKRRDIASRYKHDIKQARYRMTGTDTILYETQDVICSGCGRFCFGNDLGLTDDDLEDTY